MIYSYYVLALLILLITFYFKKNSKKFGNVILAFGDKRSYEIETVNSEDALIEESSNIVRPTSTRSQETDEKILKELNNFEKKQRFLSSNISLSGMASDFNTNISYLSGVIKKHKQTNFNRYINELRIEYIIMKLKTSPEYLNYKISYLAEECGFASHTVFIRSFSDKTGLTPSKFIDSLKTEKNAL